MDKFAYFAMSIIWRGAVHDWTLLDGTVLPASPLGDFQEEIRHYLLGDTSLPPDMVVLVIVCSDEESRKAWIVPLEDNNENCINFRFLLRGIFFRVLIGYGMPSFYRETCCTSAHKCLFYGNAKHRMPEIMRIFDETAQSELSNLSSTSSLLEQHPVEGVSLLGLRCYRRQLLLSFA